MADVLVTFGGDSSQLDAAASRVRNSVAQVQQSATDAGHAGSVGFGKLTASMTAAGVAAPILLRAIDAVVGSLKNLTVAAFEYGLQVKDMSESTGLTIAQVGILGRIAANTGTDLAAFTTGMRTLNSVMGDAMNGSEQAEKKLAQLGIKARDLVDASAIDRLRMVAEGISKIGDEATRRAVATDFFGKSTGKLIETLGEFGPALKSASEGFNASAFREHVEAVDRGKIAWDGFWLTLKEGSLGTIGATIAAIERLNKVAMPAGKSVDAVQQENIQAASARVAGINQEIAQRSQGGGDTSGLMERLARAERDLANLTGERKQTLADAATSEAQITGRNANVPDVPPATSDLMSQAQGMAEAVKFMLGEIQAGMSEAFDSTVAEIATKRVIEKMRELRAEVELAKQQSKERLAAVVADLNSEASMREEYRRIQAEAAGTEEAYHAQLRDSKLQAEQEEHEARLIALMDAQAKQLMTTQEYHARLEEENASHEAKIDGIKRQHAQSQADLEQKKLNTINGFNQKFFGNLATLMNSKNRGMFEVGKAAAIAQATISTYTAAAAGLTWGMANGGPVVAGAVVAATVAAGLAQVANIASTSFGGGGGGAGGGGGGSALESAGTGASQLGNGSGGGGGKRMTVNISGSNFSRDSVEQLLRSIDEAGADGIDVG